eukprot:gene15961-biopygen13551
MTHNSMSQRLEGLDDWRVADAVVVVLLRAVGEPLLLLVLDPPRPPALQRDHPRAAEDEVADEEHVGEAEHGEDGPRRRRVGQQQRGEVDRVEVPRDPCAREEASGRGIGGNVQAAMQRKTKVIDVLPGGTALPAAGRKVAPRG